MRTITRAASQLSLTLAFALALAACTNAPATGTTDMATTPAAGDMAMAPALYVPAGYAQVPYLTASATTHTFDMADMVLVAGKDYQAVIVTDQGRIVIDLLETQRPITVNSFVFLALHHYFDGILFHRVLANFMAQTGDPNTLDPDTTQWGGGGPGYAFDVEKVPPLKYDAAGVVGMANAGPGTNGSQFFITFNAVMLSGDTYTIFAKVTEGMDVLPKITRCPNMVCPPDHPTVMQQVYIVAK